jgi:hypothetical protein
MSSLDEDTDDGIQNKPVKKHKQAQLDTDSDVPKTKKPVEKCKQAQPDTDVTPFLDEDTDNDVLVVKKPVKSACRHSQTHTAMSWK